MYSTKSILILIVTIINLQFILAKDVLLLLGETGVGKSDTTNFLLQKNLAKVGHTIMSETRQVISYSDKDSYFTSILDPPGFWDTEGFSDEDIINLIRSQLLLSGAESFKIMIVLDGSPIRLRIKPLLEKVMSTFGSNVLDSIVFGFNMIEKSRRDLNVVRQETVNAISHLYKDSSILNSRIVLYDSHGEFNKYIQSILKTLDLVTPYKMKGMEELHNEEQRCLQTEIENPSNWKEWVEKIPSTRMIEVEKPISTTQDYAYQCNCQRVRRNIFRRRRRVCDTCIGKKEVIIMTKQQEYVIDYTDKIRKERIYSDDYLLEKCKIKISKSISDKIYNKN